jgi:hypothetical protein
LLLKRGRTERKHRRVESWPDSLVECLTGQATAPDVDVEVQIMMPLDSLLDPYSSKPATIRPDCGWGCPPPLLRGLAR